MKSLRPSRTRAFKPGFIVGTVSLVFFIIQSSCKKNSPSDIGSLGGSLSTSAASSNSHLQGTVGIRNFVQLPKSMAAVTGVNPLDSGVTSYVRNASATFSLKGDAPTVSPAMILATISLGGIYCSRLVMNEKAITPPTTRLVYQKVDFSKDQTSLTNEIRQDIFKKYSALFWRRDPTPDELTILNTAMNEALASRPLSSTELMNALVITCTAALTSLEFIKS